MKFKIYTEYFFLILFFYFFKFIGLKCSSFLGGLILSFYGRFSRRNSIAKKNIKNALPRLSKKEINNIIRGMWFHFGRVLGEYPHLSSIRVLKNTKISIENEEHLLKPLKENKNCLFFSAHIGNWELTSHLLSEKNYKINFIYRAPNNHLIDEILKKIRISYGVNLIKKGKDGAKQCIKVLNQDGGHIGMLIDQKMNDGVKTLFFGKKVMTASAIAKFALKYKCPIIPAVCVRLNGINFKINYCKPINYTKVKKLKSEINIMNYLNKYVEEWIKNNPEQWIWIHNRWE